MRGKAYIGTSGWHYRHWVGPFYPAGMDSSDFLAYYARCFQTVEINNSFYRLPPKETFAMWRETVPEGFIFAVKASRYITHMKRLKDPQSSLAAFMERVPALGDKLGPILFQLPPRMSPDTGRLETFLAALAAGYRFSFEFRDPAWFRPDIFSALEKRNAAFCIFELAGVRSPKKVTADFVYIRLHGPGDAYSGLYSPEALGTWAQDIRRWTEQGKDVYCYFDNDQLGYAVRNAGELAGLVTGNRSL